MNLSNFFSLFSNNDDPKNKEEESLSQQPSIEELMDTPVYWIGMFKKLIYNYKSFGDKLLLQVEGFDIGTDYDDVQKAYEFMLYERSYFYLSCLDVSNPKDLKILKEKSDKTLLFTLDTCLLYFEEQEEYEKCSFIKEILDLSKGFCEKT